MRPMLSAVAVSVFTILFSATGTSLARQVVVDDDRVQCRNADFSSITAAIAAAAPGERIKVCAGTYAHTVVHKTVQLHGPRAGVQAKDCFEESSDDPTREAIVAGFELLAAATVLDGFKVKSSPTGNGVDTSPTASGYDVRFNVVEANNFGVHVGSNGDALTRIRHNCVRRNNGGIFSFIQAQNVQIEHNFLTGNNGSIALLGGVFSGAPTSDITILNNELRHDGVLFIGKTVRGEVAHNRSIASGRAFGTALWSGGGNVDVTIHHNVIEAAIGQAILATMQVGVPTGKDINLVISHNRATEAQTFGILAETNGVTYEYNDLARNGVDGILVQISATNNIFRFNEADENGRDGISVNATFGGGVGNLFEQNRMFHNGQFDARDDMRPLNVWIENHCETDSPPGTICRPR